MFWSARRRRACLGSCPTSRRRCASTACRGSRAYPPSQATRWVCASERFIDCGTTPGDGIARAASSKGTRVSPDFSSDHVPRALDQKTTTLRPVPAPLRKTAQVNRIEIPLKAIAAPITNFQFNLPTSNQKSDRQRSPVMSQEPTPLALTEVRGVRVGVCCRFGGAFCGCPASPIAAEARQKLNLPVVENPGHLFVVGPEEPSPDRAPVV